jgi:hypothetical protein
VGDLKQDIADVHEAVITSLAIDGFALVDSSPVSILDARDVVTVQIDTADRSLFSKSASPDLPKQRSSKDARAGRERPGLKRSQSRAPPMCLRPQMMMAWHNKQEERAMVRLKHSQRSLYPMQSTVRRVVTRRRRPPRSTPVLAQGITTSQWRKLGWDAL